MSKDGLSDKGWGSHAYRSPYFVDFRRCSELF